MKELKKPSNYLKENMKVYNCRLCNGFLSEPKISFQDTPLANQFLKDKIKQDTFPLQVCVCVYCGHYQLNYNIPPERLFRYYSYVAGTSPVNIEHFRQYAVHMVAKFAMTKGSKVLDIASNDGTLLQHFKKLGMSILGIDPAQNIATEANRNGIETIPDFFTEAMADEILKKYGQFDLITANNVFAHIPEMIDFTKGVKKLLSSNGIFSFEVSYFGDVCDKTLLDTIYHEHSSYHTITPLVSFFKNNGMVLFDVERLQNHGGSIRIFVKNANDYIDNEAERKSTIILLLLDEKDISARVNKLATDIRILGLELREKLRDLKNLNKTIAIYGTPAKATTLMYGLGIKGEWIDFAVEDAPLKQGTWTPGNHIPILHPDEIYIKKPDVLLVLAWNFAESIINKHKEFKGTWIVPLPDYKEIKND